MRAQRHPPRPFPAALALTLPPTPTPCPFAAAAPRYKRGPLRRLLVAVTHLDRPRDPADYRQRLMSDYSGGAHGGSGRLGGSSAAAPAAGGPVATAYAGAAATFGAAAGGIARLGGGGVSGGGEGAYARVQGVADGGAATSLRHAPSLQQPPGAASAALGSAQHRAAGGIVLSGLPLPPATPSRLASSVSAHLPLRPQSARALVLGQPSASAPNAPPAPYLRSSGGAGPGPGSAASAVGGGARAHARAPPLARSSRSADTAAGDGGSGADPDLWAALSGDAALGSALAAPPPPPPPPWQPRPAHSAAGAPPHAAHARLPSRTDGGLPGPAVWCGGGGGASAVAEGSSARARPPDSVTTVWPPDSVTTVWPPDAPPAGFAGAVAAAVAALRDGPGPGPGAPPNAPRAVGSVASLPADWPGGVPRTLGSHASEAAAQAAPRHAPWPSALAHVSPGGDASVGPLSGSRPGSPGVRLMAAALSPSPSPRVGSPARKRDLTVALPPAPREAEREGGIQLVRRGGDGGDGSGSGGSRVAVGGLDGRGGAAAAGAVQCGRADRSWTG
jgi:hypothetical protein